MYERDHSAVELGRVRSGQGVRATAHPFDLGARDAVAQQLDEGW
jgi:hypothetical protein